MYNGISFFIIIDTLCRWHILFRLAKTSQVANEPILALIPSR